LIAAQNLQRKVDLHWNFSRCLLKSVGVTRGNVILGHSEEELYFTGSSTTVIAAKVDTTLRHEIAILFALAKN
jgi:triosephosphate isomerase